MSVETMADVMEFGTFDRRSLIKKAGGVSSAVTTGGHSPGQRPITSVAMVYCCTAVVRSDVD